MSAGAQIRVALDRENLQLAAKEIFEQEFHRDDDEMVRKNASMSANAEQVLKSLPARRSLADGYYMRAIYLLDLDEMLRAGVQIRSADLSREDFVGVIAVRAGRDEFRGEHPSCGACGALNERFAMACRKCGKEFKR